MPWNQRLLGQIGRKQYNEMEKAVTKITNEKKHLMTIDKKKNLIELDGMELKKYLEFVVHA